MISREEATIAMINVSMGTANDDEKLLVETMDERLFSDIYSELESGKLDSNYSIEEYYESGDETEDNSKTKWDINDDETEDSDIKDEFDKFLHEFGTSYESKDEAYKDFIENYCSKTCERNYSEEIDYDLEDLIVDEFSDFLLSNGDNYGDSEEAYDDYIRNHCNYL